jgi:hypothetical protein
MNDLLHLQAGDVSCTFDPATLWLNHLSHGEVSLLRAVYPAYRDPGWGTPAPRLEWVRREIGESGFHLVFNAFYEGVPLRWELELTGNAEGIVYRALGIAAEPVTTTRSGFCVLHAADLAGQACAIEHASGAPTQESAFPGHISPHQPFFDIRAIAHTAPDGTHVRILMEGEVFEMEDQRNWTDASFKTYCRPLSQPTPYTLEPGEPVRQQVSVQWTGGTGLAPDPDALTLEWHTLPELGLLKTHQGTLKEEEGRALLQAGISYLRVDLDATGDLAAPLAEAAADAANLQLVLEAALYLGEELPAALREADLRRVSRWLVYGKRSKRTEPGHVEMLRGLGHPAPIGGGADGNFTELNRGQTHLEGLDFAGFPMWPQQHSVDDASVLENALVQGQVLASARARYPGVEFRAPSVTLALRRRPWEGPDSPFPTQDPRLGEDFGALWTLASLAALLPARLPSITLHGTTGPRGILRVGGTTPVARLLGALQGGTEAMVRQEGQLLIFALRGPGMQRLLMGNLSPGDRQVPLPPEAQLATFLTGDPYAILPTRGPLALPGYAIVQVDL